MLVLAFITTPSFGHEFWLDLDQGVLSPGNAIVADLKVGQKLKGESYPYLSKYIRTFTVTAGGERVRVTGNEGDLPALRFLTQRAGLHVIAHETIPFRVTYDDWSIFLQYLQEEGLQRFAAQHKERSLPEAGFSERYTRCVKALVQVGDVGSRDADIVVGMPLEFVAQANPYRDGADQLKVKLLWHGAPLTNWQINIFRDTDAFAQSKIVTDDYGIAVVTLSGAGNYLLNATHLEAVEDNPIVWESYWATLSFKLPATQHRIPAPVTRDGALAVRSTDLSFE